MKILAIDTSTDYLTLALTDGENVLAQFNKKSHRSHSRLLIAMIDKLLKRCRVKLRNIDGFCIGIGPGSFTGLRIGVTTIKGLAYSLEKPVAAVPTFDVIARNVKNFKGIICPVLDARKNKVYACLYKSDGKNIKRISKYLLISVKELMEKTAKYDKIFFLGDCPDLIHVRDMNWYPKAEVLGRLGFEDFKKKRFIKPEDLEPMYLYSKECDVTGR